MTLGAGLTYTLDSTVQNGVLRLNGVALSVGQSFTQDDIDNGRVTYDHDGSETLGDSFSFVLEDGLEDGVVGANGTFNITINPVNDQPTDIAPNSFVVVENTDTSSGYSVGTLTTTDSDPGDTFTYSIVGGADAGVFSIGGVGNDELILSDGVLDFETQSFYNVRVRVTDSGGLSYEEDLSVQLQDVNEAPMVALSNVIVTLPENTDTTASVRVADIDIIDDALGTNDLSLSGPDAGYFEIVGNELHLVAGTNLDREGKFVFDVTVEVLDESTGPALTGNTASYTLTLTDVDEFDVTAPVDLDATPNSVAEDALVGSTVNLQVDSVDLDATTNTVSYSLDDDAGGRFAIDSVSGLVTVSGALDFETATSHTITVRASSSDGSVATQTFTIQIDDVNEFAITGISDTDVAPEFVLENSSLGSTVGITAVASDADGSDSVSYSLDVDAGGRFAIDATTGVVTVSGALDREASPLYNITIRATSTDGSFATQVYTVSIGDVDEFDVGPITDSDPSANLIVENVPGGVVARITALATDADATNNGVTYSLVNDDGGRFVIDSMTGVISSTQALDFETEGPVRQVRVLATSQDGSTRQQDFTINIGDVNEAPTLSLINQTTSLSELADASSGIKVADIVIADDALGTNQLTLTGPDAANFEILGTGLYLRPGVILDFETNPQFNISIELDDTSLGLALEDVVGYTLDILDANDAPPVVTPGQVFHVDENSPANTSVGQITATDVDSPGTLTGWAIVAGNQDGQFVIDPGTGELRVAAGANLNFESVSSYVLTVSVSDGVQTSTLENVTVLLNDINDRPEANPDLLVVDQFETVLVNSPGVLANDLDEDGNALTVTLVSAPTNGLVTLQVDGSFTFIPLEGYFGIDSFTYVVSDGQLTSEVTTVEILVQPFIQPESDTPDSNPDDSGPEADPDSKPGLETVAVKEVVVIPSEIQGEPDESPKAAAKIQANESTSEKVEQLVDAFVKDEVESRSRTRGLTTFEVSLRSDVKVSALRSQSFEVDAVSRLPLTLNSTAGRDSSGLGNEIVQMDDVVVGSTAVTTATLSVGYILWMFRGGTLLASFMTTLPAWTQFDPLSIVIDSHIDEDSESLVDIADQELQSSSEG